MNMSGSKPYLVTFEPVGKFFFGGLTSLGESFYAESVLFPQPTTILGCLRTAILLQNGLRREDNIFPEINDKAKVLTGTSGINGIDDSNDDFGVIKGISPVFLVKLDEENKIKDFLFHAPFDVIEKNTEDKSENDTTCLEKFSYSIHDKAVSGCSKGILNYAVLLGKDHKSLYADYYGGKDFWKAYINDGKLHYDRGYNGSEIFKKNISVGIGRENRVAKEGKYYVKKDFYFAKKFAFGVIVWLADEEAIKKDVVTLGGDRSTFVMEVIPLDNIGNLEDHPVIASIRNKNCNIDHLDNSVNKLVALSPIIVDPDFYEEFSNLLRYKISPYIHVTKFVKRIAKFTPSKAVRMLPASSVFYLDWSGKPTFSSSVSWKIPFKIGYNYVLKVNNKGGQNEQV